MLSTMAIQNVECFFFDSNLLSFIHGDPEDPIRVDVEELLPVL